ncbi:MAG: Wzz/FepE/Etk N-terminal domain-containing protein [Gemmatimonadota bacterium]|nr:Wzz/FepE/Etk N-terminal domain-containing protein [Gemmatimonadota bacterium]MDH3421388.1 Wzz/FepE/Etk N-terminal domain-containing protein [Gemmatimonadota bacterium]
MTSDPQHGGGGPAAATSRLPDDEISLWEVLAVLLRRRGTIALAIFVCVGLAVAYTLLRPDTFTTQASFQPQGSEASASQLLALAGQFGVNVPGGGDELSPAFYAELLASREILHRVAARSYLVESRGTVPLIDLLEIEEDTEPLRVEEAIGRLRDDIVSIATGRETGILTIEVTTEWPELSTAIAERLLDEIQVFNLETRRSQAAAERVFIEARVDSARVALITAEDAMQVFLQANRRYEDSPELTFQAERLQREIARQQQVYTGLVQSFEEARIAEVRDTPVITVLQSPYLPPGPDDRSLLLGIALGLVLGGMAGVVLAFLVEAVRRPAPGDPAREDFQRAWDALVRSIPLVGRAS